MKKTRVTIQLASGPREIEGCEAVPGILVHRDILRAWEGQPVLYHSGNLQVTHIASGASLGGTYFTRYSDLVKRVKAHMGGLDWSISTDEILASAAHLNAARVAIHGQ